MTVLYSNSLSMFTTTFVVCAVITYDIHSNCTTDVQGLWHNGYETTDILVMQQEFVCTKIFDTMYLFIFVHSNSLLYNNPGVKYVLHQLHNLSVYRAIRTVVWWYASELGHFCMWLLPLQWKHAYFYVRLRYCMMSQIGFKLCPWGDCNAMIWGAW